jgi:hypothetical protein
MSEVATAPLDSVFGILTNKWGIYVHNPTVTRENCAVQHWKVSYNKNRIDPICENVVVQLNLSDCVNGPLKFLSKKKVARLTSVFKSWTNSSTSTT